VSRANSCPLEICFQASGMAVGEGTTVAVGGGIRVGAGVTGDKVAVSSAVVFVGVVVKLEQACMIRTKRLTMIFTCFLSIIPPEVLKRCFSINPLLNEQRFKYTTKNAVTFHHDVFYWCV
jgi:hypothetical protein